MPQIPPERDQPFEVPYREIEHDEPADPDTWPWEPGRYTIGHVRDREWWGSTADNKNEEADLKRRDASRAKLGGFGFCLARA